ncbi:MAG: GAF and ANTAR domain-containing protein [Propionibacteriales bacterium]|nr:GAF and ANTAR domain-containing protein [Propionibacteriales bacterium]
MDKASEFADLAMALHDHDVEETLNDIAEFARKGLECDHAGLHITIGRRVETAAASDQLIKRAGEMQSEVGEGPCLDAVWEHDTFVVRDTATDDRWPVFGPMAADLGLHSILSVRLYDDAQTLGALNLYSTNVREFDSDDVALAHIFGSHASVALSSARKQEGLRRAVDARHLIGLAQGILMERFGLDVDQAFSVLRRYSQDNNVKLRDVAEHVIETRSLPGKD